MAHPLDKIQEPLRRVGEGFARAAMAIGNLAKAMTDYIAALYDYGIRGVMALKEAPPRVRHLALHSKKRRTRKKNINRALREYKKKQEDRDHVQATV